MTAEDKLAVLITGAAGGTGRLVFEKLLNHDFYEGNALVHTKESVKKLKDLEIPEGRISVADISKGPSPELDAAMKGIQALIICTSAMPKMVSPPKEGVPPQFAYEEGQYPEQVDWIGQKAQIDAAKKAGANQVVIVSSMGGTDKNNRLNSLGNGNILVYKRKAEEYLIQQDFTSYTILHPGGLIDEKGGERELVLGVDDKLMQESSRSIPRADVAELCVQCLGEPEAQNRSVDVISRKPGQGTPTTDFGALFSGFQENCKY
jgi:uncharacterized protein YbjT (DUF2867 family)